VPTPSGTGFVSVPGAPDTFRATRGADVITVQKDRLTLHLRSEGSSTSTTLALPDAGWIRGETVAHRHHVYTESTVREDLVAYESLLLGGNVRVALTPDGLVVSGPVTRLEEMVILADAVTHRGGDVHIEEDDGWMTSTLAWSHFLGGDRLDAAWSTHVLPGGDIVVVGATESLDFPVVPPAGARLVDDLDLFVCRYNPDGTVLRYSTIIGGSRRDNSDLNGSAVSGSTLYVAGNTYSADFPVTEGAADVSLDGDNDAILLALDVATGYRRWATFLGGSGVDVASPVIVDADGCPVVAGATQSQDFPMAGGMAEGGPCQSFDAFVTRFSPDGSQILASSVLRGDGIDICRDLVLRPDGSLSAVGWSSSENFAWNAGAFDLGHAGSFDAFVLDLSASLDTGLRLTFVGGSDRDLPYAAALAPSGELYLVGRTLSPDLPTTERSFQRAIADLWGDAFVACIGASGVSATYLGGDVHDVAYDVAVLADGRVMVGGGTYSSDFPVTADAHDGEIALRQDGFVVALSPALDRIEHGTFLGGSDFDQINALVVVGEEVIMIGVTGNDPGTSEPVGDFPTTPGGDTTFGGEFDSFLARMTLGGDEALTVPPLSSTVAPLMGAPSPFRTHVSLSWPDAEGRPGAITIFDVHGREIRHLEGSWPLVWDGTRDDGRAAAAGRYLIHSEGIDGTTGLAPHTTGVTLLR
jgi:hypothetical protein